MKNAQLFYLNLREKPLKNAKYDCEKTCLEINNKIAFTV